MARFIPNPNFSIKDAIDGAKGEFTCPQCEEKYTETVRRLPNGKLGITCPKCGATCQIKS